MTFYRHHNSPAGTVTFQAYEYFTTPRQPKKPMILNCKEAVRLALETIGVASYYAILGDETDDDKLPETITETVSYQDICQRPGVIFSRLAWYPYDDDRELSDEDHKAITDKYLSDTYDWLTHTVWLFIANA